jgi:DNA repair protein RecO (recombination protein O)
VPDSIITPAIIMSKVPYQENDLVLGLLTRNEGPVSVVARSARSSRRRFAGVLDLFVVFDAAMSPGRGGLPVLTGADPVRFFPGIHDSLERLEAGQAIIQSVRDMVRDAPAMAAAFDGIVSSFGYLESAAPGLAYLIHLEAVICVAAELGHVPVDGVCPGCGRSSDRFVLGGDGIAACADRCAPGRGMAAVWPAAYLTRIPLADNPASAPAAWHPDRRIAMELISLLVCGISGMSAVAPANPEYR